MSMIRFGRFFLTSDVIVEQGGKVYNLYVTAIDHEVDIIDSSLVKDLTEGWLKDHYGFVEYRDVKSDNLNNMMEYFKKIGLETKSKK